MSPETSSTERITLCACASRSFVDKEKVFLVASSLRANGYEVRVEPDLCQKALTEPSALHVLAASTLIACYPRAVKFLFNAHGETPKQILDIRNNTAASLLQAFGITATQPLTDEALNTDSLATTTGNDAWYPVIDKDRCNECGQCHDFCLFGVYSVVNGEVRVTQPENCKNNCPACARVCPSKAVIFPKYAHSPINGGLSDDELATAVDTKALYANALKLKLDQRKAGVSLLKKEGQ